jgi:hypothetical protein
VCGIHKGGSCAYFTSVVNRGFHKTGFGSLSEVNGGGGGGYDVHMHFWMHTK